jgi:hypothetical protein
MIVMHGILAQAALMLDCLDAAAWSGNTISQLRRNLITSTATALARAGKPSLSDAGKTEFQFMV